MAQAVRGTAKFSLSFPGVVKEVASFVHVQHVYILPFCPVKPLVWLPQSFCTCQALERLTENRKFSSLMVEVCSDV